MLILAAFLALAAGPICYDGIVGEGAGARRAIVSSVEPGSALVQIHDRRVREFEVSSTGPLIDRMISPDSTTRLTLDGEAADLEARLGTRRVTGRLTRVGGEGTPGAAGALEAGAARGVWYTRTGPGGVFRLIVRLGIGPCGLVVGTLDSPDQGQLELPLTGARLVGDTLLLEAAYMNLALRMPVRGAGTREGTLVQNGIATGIQLHAGDGAARRPQEPRPPFPYEQREVRFNSRAPGQSIAGTLTLPATAGPHPAIILISGSGAQDRDQTIAGHRTFLVLSDHLTRLGYAVLRADDRGAGGTAGKALDTSLEDVSHDALGALDHLLALPEIDASAIGILGHSEGGYVAPIAAEADPRIRFLILLTAPSLPGREALLSQRAAMTRGHGTAEADVQLDSTMLATIFAVLDTHLHSERMPVAVDSALARWLTGLPAGEQRAAREMLAARSAAADSQSVALWSSRWFSSRYAHDPAAYLRRLDIPILAVLGQLDLQVPPGPNAVGFAREYRGAREALLSLHVLDGVNHMLQPATTGRMDEYADIEVTIATPVLEVITNWLRANVSDRPRVRTGSGF